MSYPRLPLLTPASRRRHMASAWCICVTIVTSSVWCAPVASATSNGYWSVVPTRAAGRSVAKDELVNVKVLRAVGVRRHGRVRGSSQPRLRVSRISIHLKGSLVGDFGGAVTGDVEVSLTNTGNTKLTPRGELWLSPLLGGRSHLPRMVVPPLLPRRSATFEVPFSGVIPFGQMSARLVITAPGVEVSGSSGVVVIPWALLVLLALVVTGTVLRRRGRHRSRGPVSAAEFFAPPKHFARKAYAVRI